MEITMIRVVAGRTFNHPHEQYSNLRPEVELVAALAPGEDPDAAVKGLQAKAEKLVEDHKQNLLRCIEELYEMSAIQAEAQDLERKMKSAQERLEELRKARPGAFKQLSFKEGSEGYEGKEE